MRHVLQSTSLIMAVLLGGVPWSGCSEDPACGVPGATQACLCVGGASGVQSCQTDGAWSTCVCSVEDVGHGDLGAHQTDSTDTVVADPVADVHGHADTEVLTDQESDVPGIDGEDLVADSTEDTSDAVRDCAEEELDLVGTDSVSDRADSVDMPNDDDVLDGMHFTDGQDAVDSAEDVDSANREDVSDGVVLLDIGKEVLDGDVDADRPTRPILRTTSFCAVAAVGGSDSYVFRGRLSASWGRSSNESLSFVGGF